ncbi:type I restriction endonuclease subunit M [Acidovorax sp. SUPP1855]|nr:type I restriction endonuclease subunit M [Acidovorax sp. SUPP1855]GKS92600.1 type I restriction endonuclease subunit M [Acidovorax sp. SUPP2539]GKS97443.1 type I restriction endonuclease subunit M [Acidovorax sp. SUPP2825]
MNAVYEAPQAAQCLPRFPLGSTVMTQGVNALVAGGRLNPYVLLRRHLLGDWGDLCEDDRRLNDQAVRLGNRILSAYQLEGNTTVWIITECDRSVTTLLLPSEY